MTTGVDRRQGRLDTQGLEAIYHLLGDHPVGAHSAEADAAGRRQVRERAGALVARGSIAIADTKLSSAPRAAEKTDQQSFAAANGAAAHEPFAVGVVGNQGLIPLEVGPRNIALVVIRDQNAPASPIALHAPQDVLSPVLDDDAHRSSPEGVGAGVDRVGQNMMHGRIHRRFPNDPLGVVANRQDGQRNLLLPEPHEHLPDRLEFRKPAEHQADGLLDAPIGILFDQVAPRLHVAHGHGQEEFAPTRLLLHRFDRALAEDGKLHLAHRPLHAEQQPVVRGGRIVYAVFVDDDRADQAAKLQQGVPVTPVAGQARRLHGHDGADTPFADRREQPLEPRAPNAAGRSAEIVVDNLDVLPTKQSRPVGKAVLSTLALQIVRDLLGRRLPNIDNCAASQMVRRYLRHRTPPPGSWSPSRALGSSPRPTALATNPAPFVARSP